MTTRAIALGAAAVLAAGCAAGGTTAAAGPLAAAASVPPGGGAAAGALDASFGVRGTVVLPPAAATDGPGWGSSVWSAVPSASGGVLATWRGGYQVWARTATGAPDTRLGPAGVVAVHPSSAPFEPAVLAALPGGGFVVAQQVGRADATGGNGVVVRAVDGRGRPVTSWGVGGSARWHGVWSGDNAPAGMVRLGDGRVRVCVSTTGYGPGAISARLVGLTAAGRLDTAVGPGGSRALPGLVSCAGLGVDGAGRLLAAGTTAAGTLGVVRTSATGVPDPGYGNGGLAVAGGPGRRLVPAAHGLAVTARSTAYVAVTARTGAAGAATTAATSAAGVVRLDASGRPAAGFGDAGLALVGAAGGASAATAVGLAPGEKVLLAWTRALPGPRAQLLTRLAAPTGAVDPSFAARGTLVLAQQTAAVWTDRAGRIWLAGNTGRWSYGRWTDDRGVVQRRLG